MEDKMIATLPIKPREKTNIGMLIGPTIMDYVGSSMDIQRVMGVNVLNTYNDKSGELSGFLDTLSSCGINYDSLFIDQEHADKLLEIVDRLFSTHYIAEKSKNLLRCQCGCVDMIYEAAMLNKAGKLFEVKDGKCYCKRCGQECIVSTDKVLVFHLDETVDSHILITPSFLQGELGYLDKAFRGKDILISKNRNTGFTVNGYNIDIDFLWSNLFNLFDAETQIFIASNHQLFNLYLINYIAKMTSDKQLHFIATPYVRGDINNATEQYNSKDLEEYKKLFILYNLIWTSKDCNWSESTTKYLMGISDTKIKNLYRTMLINAREMLLNYQDMNEAIERIVNQGTNMQENIKLMRKLYKEGQLS